MPKIFLSYRRNDSKWIAGRIFDRLEDHFGTGQVFIDIDSMAAGFDFRDQIRMTMESCNILLAIVGPGWSEYFGIEKHNIATQPDWVRTEIEYALESNIPIIPILIDDAVMPKPEEIPPSISKFTYRQAANIESGKDFRIHMDRLIRAIENYFSSKPPEIRDTRASVPQETPTPCICPLSKMCDGSD